MIYLESPSTDAAFNLALEEYVFQKMPKDREYFMLWQNTDAVIVGKHQNVWEEVNVSYIRENEIPVIRRLSGGGAVFHDLGNLNFTYIVNGEDPQMAMERFAGPLLLACKEFGIEAEITGRNDITVNGRKFSGNARYQEDGRIMHHGTILIGSDLEKMVRTLSAAPDKYISKGIASVRSRVVNLRECTSEALTVEDFWNTFKKQLPLENKPYVWTEEDLGEICKIRDQRYSTWQWNYGNFPMYQVERRRRLEGCGTVTVSMNVLAGTIEELKITGDFLGSGAVYKLEDLLYGCPLRKEKVKTRLETISLPAIIIGMTADKLADLICDN